MKITLKNISISYNKEVLLNNLQISFQDGKLSCLLGPSGSGKTTILKIIAGVSDSYRGDLLFDDENVNELQVGKRLIGWVPQQQLLFPGMSVYENIVYGLKARNVPKDEQIKRVDEIAKLVGVSHLLHRAPERLSGGERQRVAIARALAPKPEMLLLDEPFSSLDAPERDKLVLIMREIQLITGITTIHVTHSPREADILADRVYILADGVIQQSGTLDELRKNPSTIYVASIVGVPNVLNEWQDMGSVIIPPEAITFHENGTFEGRILSITKNKIYLKVLDIRLEMNNKDQKVSIGEIKKIVIDNELIRKTGSKLDK